MAFFNSLPQLVLLGSVLYLSWLALRPFLVKSALDNIPGPPPTSFVRGSLQHYLGRHCWEWREECARKYPRISTITAFFGRKWINVSDTKALHHVLVKEQDFYEEPIQTMRIILGPGLLGTLGDQHKRQRKILNPVFSTKHLREMMPIFYDVIHKTRDALMQRVSPGASGADGSTELDMLSWMGRTTLEVLGQAGLGHSFDPLTEDRPDEFATAVKDLFPQMAKSAIARVLLPMVATIGTTAFRRRMVDWLPLAGVQRLKEISDIMHERSVLIYNEKKTALEKGDDMLKQQVGEGRDIMSILLRANMQASENDRLLDEELIAQVSTLTLAGMDTTANSLARLLELLADHPDVQEKLRQEILLAVESDGDGDTLGFDKLMELPYLDAICRETLRVSPGVPNVFRDTIKDTILPLSEPIRLRDGTLCDALPLPKGTRVVSNIIACNRDPALWGPDADEWRPERWLEPLPRAVEEARISGVYSPLMTFIAGSRACIGFKLAQVEMKSVLFILLQYFKLEPTGKPIAWNFAAVQYPTVGRDSLVPELPLRVSLIQR